MNVDYFLPAPEEGRDAVCFSRLQSQGSMFEHSMFQCLKFSMHTLGLERSTNFSYLNKNSNMPLAMYAGNFLVDPLRIDVFLENDRKQSNF